MKKYEIINSEGFTVLESNHLYDCESYIQEHQSSVLVLQDNRPEMIKKLNAMSKEIAKKIESKGGVNPSYEKLVAKFMSDPDNVWVSETDSSDLMSSYVSLQKHVLERVNASKLPIRKSK